MSSAVKKSGAPWGPYRTAISQVRGYSGSGPHGRGHRRLLRRDVPHPQDVARPQRPAAVAAEAAQQEGGPAAEERRHVEPAPHRQVDAGARPRPAAGDAAHAQQAAGRHGEGAALGHRPAVDAGRHLGAGERHHRLAAEAQGRAHQGDLQRRRAGRVAHQAVGQPEGEVVHRDPRAARPPPTARAARASPAPSSGCLPPARRWRRPPARRSPAGRSARRRAEGGVLRAPAAGSRGWSRCRRCACGRGASARRASACGAVGPAGDDLDQQRIVVGRDLEARLDPAVAAQRRRAARPP